MGEVGYNWFIVILILLGALFVFVAYKIGGYNEADRKHRALKRKVGHLVKYNVITAAEAGTWLTVEYTLKEYFGDNLYVSEPVESSTD